MDLSVLKNFITISKRIDDTREQYKVKHKMSDIVIIVLLGIPNTWNEIGFWLENKEICLNFMKNLTCKGSTSVTKLKESKICEMIKS